MGKTAGHFTSDLRRIHWASLYVAMYHIANQMTTAMRPARPNWMSAHNLKGRPVTAAIKIPDHSTTRESVFNLVLLSSKPRLGLGCHLRLECVSFGVGFWRERHHAR